MIMTDSVRADAQTLGTTEEASEFASLLLCNLLLKLLQHLLQLPSQCVKHRL